MDTYGKILEKDKEEAARKIEKWDLKMESWCYVRWNRKNPF